MSFLFSVVIPVHNRAGLIKTTLQSVFAQTDTNYEIICVDDGSTDDSLEVLKSYGDRIAVVEQANAGPGAARNNGIHHATGEYVAFLDSDDLWFPWTLGTYREAIEKLGKPAVLCSQMFYLEDDEHHLRIQEGIHDFNYFDDYLSAAAEGIYVSSGVTAVRRDCLNEVGGFINEHINAEDHDLTLRLGVHSGFTLVKSPVLVGIRRHAGQITQVSSKTVAGLFHLIKTEQSGGYPGGHARERDRRRILAQHIRSFSVEIARSGNVPVARQFYEKTFLWQLADGRWKYLAALPLIAWRARLFKQARAVRAIPSSIVRQRRMHAKRGSRMLADE